MIYSDGAAMDNNGKVLQCPRCQNTEIDDDAEHCIICGLSLYNECTGDWEHGIPYHRNSSNARFCKICGNKTTYFALGVLRPYTEVQNLMNSSVPNTVVYFSNAVSGIDEPPF